MRETSIFADFRPDNEAIMDQCFQHDSKYWKINRLTKSADELTQTLQIVKENYQMLKDLFMTVNSNSRYPFINMIDFGRFIQQMKLLDETLDLNSLDRIFIAANTRDTSLEQTGTKQSKDLNPENLLVRHKFVEALVRCA